MSPKSNTILLATDFSSRSEEAQAHALRLAIDGASDLLLVHAIEPIIGLDEHADSEEFDEFYGRLLKRAETEIDKRLEAWHDHHLIVRHHVEIGHRWQVILERADVENVDIIVMGRRMYHPGQPVPLGTTSQKIFFGTKRPVLFVPQALE